MNETTLGDPAPILSIIGLPNDIWMLIYKLLNPKELLILNQTCIFHHNFINTKWLSLESDENKNYLCNQYWYILNKDSNVSENIMRTVKLIGNLPDELVTKIEDQMRIIVPLVKEEYIILFMDTFTYKEVTYFVTFFCNNFGRQVLKKSGVLQQKFINSFNSKFESIISPIINSYMLQE